MTVSELRALLAPLDGDLHVVVDCGGEDDPATAAPLAVLALGRYQSDVGGWPEFGDFWSAERREVPEPNALCLRCNM